MSQKEHFDFAQTGCKTGDNTWIPYAIYQVQDAINRTDWYGMCVQTGGVADMVTDNTANDTDSRRMKWSVHIHV